MRILDRLLHLRSTLRRRRAAISRGLALIAVLSMGLSAWWFQPQLESLAHYRPTPGPEDYYDPRAPWCFLAGLLALIGALALRPAEGRLVRRRERVDLSLRAFWRFVTAARQGFRSRGGGLDAAFPRWAWGFVVPGVLSLLALAEANGAIIGFEPLASMTPPVQLALLIEGVTLIVLGLAGLPRRSVSSGDGANVSYTDLTPRPPLHPVERGNGSAAVPLSISAALGVGPGRQIAAWARRESVFVLLITVAALAVRFGDLRDSVRVMIDEGHYALGVAYFWEFPDVRLLEPMPTTASFPFIFSYGQAAMTAIFGRSFLGLRAFSAVLGGLTVPALYLLARQVYDRRTAVLAALVLLTFPPQVHYSRLALNNIADPLFGTLALGLLMAGVRTRRRHYYVLGGAALGFTQYFYEGGRLLYPALAAAWMAAGLLLWRPRPSARGLILAAVTFVLVAAPIYYTLIGRDFPLTDRLDKSEYDPFYWTFHREPDNFHTRIIHFRHSLMVYVNAPENTSFNYYLYYGGKHPLILPAIVPLFLLGIGIAAWRWRTPGALPLGWVLATSLGNAMLVESAVSARYVVVFPALALLIAVGIRCTLPLLWPPRWPQRLQAGLMLVLAGVVMVGQGRYYFGPFLDYFNVEVRATLAYDVDDAMLRSAGFPPDTRIFVIGDPLLPEGDAQRLLNYVADDLKVYVLKPAQFASLELHNLGHETDLAFFFGADDFASLAKLQNAYGPQPLLGSPYPVPNGKALLLFYVPARSP